MLSIMRETPQQDAVLRLLWAADERSAAFYPDDSRFGLTADALTARSARFFVARLHDQAVGCGGFTLASPTEGELQRMFVDAALRRHGIGRSLLRAIEGAARAESVQVMRLETGVASTEALGLYRRSGYRERGPFGDYASDPRSVFMEKALWPSGMEATFHNDKLSD